MQESFVFSVHIGNKMFTALWKIQDCLQVDDLGPGGAERGILPGKHSQVAQLLCGVGFVLFHHMRSPLSDKSYTHNP